MAGIAEETSRRLSVLKTAAQDFNQMLSLIDGNFDGRLGEIKGMELKRDSIKAEIEEVQKKASSILNEATERVAVMNQEAAKLMGEAQSQKNQAKVDMEEAEKKKNEAKALWDQAIQRQKEADVAWHVLDQRKKKLEEAMR